LALQTDTLKVNIINFDSGLSINYEKVFG